MPIYEYEAIRQREGCSTCGCGFEVFQTIREEPLAVCPDCGGAVKQIVSRCHAAMIERSTDDVRAEARIKEYERSGMWSHAAELADKHSEKTGDRQLKTRALDNYRKAGYDFNSSDGT